MLGFLKRDGGALKLTINQFYRVNGDSTQNHGVHSDVVLPSLLDHMDLGESFLENALAFDQIEPDEFVASEMVTPEIISSLARSSEKRIAANPKFQEILKDIEKLTERKKKKVISLNEDVLRKDRGKEKKEQDKERISTLY